MPRFLQFVNDQATGAVGVEVLPLGIERPRSESQR